MSRGLGKLQERILAELEHGHASAHLLCERLSVANNLYTRPVVGNTYGALKSIQRALRSLHDRGLVVRLPGRYLAVIRESDHLVETWGARAHYCLPRHAERIAAAHRGRRQLFEDRCGENECHTARLHTRCLDGNAYRSTSP